MWFANPDGGGIAVWTPDTGLTLTRGIMRASAWADATVSALAIEGSAVLAHTRISTAGGIRPALTHPWPVLAPDTDTVVGALAHNGHWSEAEAVLEADLRAQADATMADPTGYGLADPDPDPREAWSDSRVIVHLARVYGPDYALRHRRIVRSGQRLAYLSAQDGRIRVAGYGWSNLRPGVRVSNRSWQWQTSPSLWPRMWYTGLSASGPQCPSLVCRDATCDGTCAYARALAGQSTALTASVPRRLAPPDPTVATLAACDLDPCQSDARAATRLGYWDAATGEYRRVARVRRASDRKAGRQIKRGGVR